MKKEFLEMKTILKDNGYKEERRNGSHFIFKNADGNTISVNKDLNKMVRQRLIKENRLKVLR